MLQRGLEHWSPMPGCQSSSSGFVTDSTHAFKLHGPDTQSRAGPCISSEATVQAIMNTRPRLWCCWNSQCMLQCAATLGLSLWQELLTRVQTDPSLSATNYQINSAVHRAKLQAWQALAVLSAFVHAQPASTEAAIDQLWPYLQVCSCCLQLCCVMSSSACE